jgi:SsrA-binding protein
MKIIAKNRKAYYNYEILDKKIAGMVLRGWQVKSIKAGNASFADAYCFIHKGEMYLRGLHISDWPGMGEFEKKQKNEDIKLLLKQREIDRWHGKLKQKGLTVVPLALGLSRGYVKIEIGLAKGKQKHDKRKRLKEKQQKRDLERDLSNQKYF